MAGRLVGYAAAALFATAGSALAGGTLKGTVRYEGKAPPPEKIAADKDVETCGKHELVKEDLLVSASGGVKNAVVTIEKVTGGKAPEVPAEPVHYDQVGCRFVDHVKVVPVGAKVDFLNSDDVSHNVHTYSMKNTTFNRDIPGGNKYTYEAKFAERIEVKCDRHPWMKGYVVVVDTPYFAVTDENGSFSIEGLPKGEWQVKVWHESLGLLDKRGAERKVTVPASGDPDPATWSYPAK